MSPAPSLSDRHRVATVIWFLLLALLTRGAVLGDVSYFNDEAFYRLAGLRLHDGLLPYADVWDRKGPALFLLWWLIGFLPGGVWAYQLLALLAAAATAIVIAAITRRFAGAQGALLAGSIYLVSLPMFSGAGGQSPVFYNLPVALAALLMLRSRGALARGQMPRDALLAMVLAGTGIAFKQTAMFEGAFLGLSGVAAMLRGRVPARQVCASAGLMIAAGCAPLLLGAAFCALTGHGAVFWHAMVTSNLTRHYDVFGDYGHRLGLLAAVASPMLLPAVCGLLLPLRVRGESRLWIALWIAAAVAGVLALPNLYDHYLLPLMVPVSVAAGLALDRGIGGWLVALGIAYFYAMTSPMFAFDSRHAASARVEALAARIRAHEAHPRLLVYEGPMGLYSLVAGTRPHALDQVTPPSPLLDNFHLYFPGEDNTSPFDTADEMRRILAWRPTVVTVASGWPPGNENRRTRSLVDAYIMRHCRLWQTMEYNEARGLTHTLVYGDCAADRARIGRAPAGAPRSPPDAA